MPLHVFVLTFKPAMIAGIIPTFEKIEYRPPILFSCLINLILLVCAILDKGLGLSSVIIKQFS